MNLLFLLYTIALVAPIAQVAAHSFTPHHPYVPRKWRITKWSHKVVVLPLKGKWKDVKMIAKNKYEVRKSVTIVGGKTGHAKIAVYADCNASKTNPVKLSFYPQSKVIKFKIGKAEEFKYKEIVSLKPGVAFKKQARCKSYIFIDGKKQPTDIDTIIFNVPSNPSGAHGK